MKRADRSGALCALIIGDDELQTSTVVLKHLRSDQDQETVALDDLQPRLARICKDTGAA